MTSPTSRWPIRSLTMVLALAVLAPGTAVGQQETEGASPPLPSSLPTLGADMVSIPFSVAPVRASDQKLTILVDKRGCGLRRREQPRAITAVVETAHAAIIRVDVGAGKDGKPCPSDRLERHKVHLTAVIGERTVMDATRDEVALVTSLTPSTRA